MKLLIVLPRFPFPLEKGDKLRAYNFIKYLSKKHKLYLFSISDTKCNSVQFENLKKYCEEVVVYRRRKIFIIFSLIKALFSKIPFQVHYFYSKAAQKQLDILYKKIEPDLIFCQLIRVSKYVIKYNKPKILDYMDAFSKGIQRRKEKAFPLFRIVYNMEYKRLVEYERNVFQYFESKMIISDIDRNEIQHSQNDIIQVIPNGVDFGYFKPIADKKIFDLLFVGNLAYPPNIRAVFYICNKIMPILKTRHQDIKLLIAGAQPKKSLYALVNENVEIKGWVKDIRTCYSQSKIMIAPLEIGTGLQNKILEAMAMKILCIASPLVNQAIKAEPNKEIIIADSPDEYAGLVEYFLENENQREIIVDNAFTFVRKNFNWDDVGINIDKIIDGLVSVSTY